MKTTVSIRDDVFQRAERLAEQTHRSRSRLYSDALREYLARHESDAVTNAMNEALAEIEQGSDDFSNAANRAVFANPKR